MAKKHNFQKWIIVLFLLAGLGMICYPFAQDWISQFVLNREMSRYAQVLESDPISYDDLWAEAEEYNEYLLNKDSQLMVLPEEKEWVTTLLNPLNTGMMGTIQIPKISISLPIYQGTEDQELQAGAGWWIGSSLPTGGKNTHCVLTGHNGLIRAKMFTDIDQLEYGDKFTLTVLDRTMTYEVDKIIIIEPEDQEPLKIVPGEDRVSLYTCYPYGINNQRLIVSGIRCANEESNLSFSSKMGSIFRRYPVLLLLLAAAAILLLFLGAKQWKRRRLRKENSPQ